MCNDRESSEYICCLNAADKVEHATPITITGSPALISYAIDT